MNCERRLHFSFLKNCYICKNLDLKRKDLYSRRAIGYTIEMQVNRSLRRLKKQLLENALRPPELKIKRLAIQHHSPSDWNFESGSYDIDTDVYRTAPASLKYRWGTPSKFVCNVAGTENLPEGRVEAWFRKAGSSYARFWGFCGRVQYPTWAQMYGVKQAVHDGVGNQMVSFYKDDVAVKSVLVDEPPVNTWFKRRFTWWNSGSEFILRVEKYNGSWTQLCGDYVDVSPSYGASGVNACGIYSAGHTIDVIHVDDIVISGPC